jgi:hypothetical protein
LPETSGVAVDERRAFAQVRKCGAPNQRPITENPERVVGHRRSLHHPEKRSIRLGRVIPAQLTSQASS